MIREDVRRVPIVTRAAKLTILNTRSLPTSLSTFLLVRALTLIRSWSLASSVYRDAKVHTLSLYVKHLDSPGAHAHVH